MNQREGSYCGNWICHGVHLSHNSAETTNLNLTSFCNVQLANMMGRPISHASPSYSPIAHYHMVHLNVDRCVCVLSANKPKNSKPHIVRRPLKEAFLASKIVILD